MHNQLSAIGGKLAAFKLGAFDASDAIFVLGLLTAAWIALRIVGAILGFVTAPAKRKISAYGQWAVVTGATDGIGKAYATELAKRGLDVVIIGRSAEKLKATETEIAGKTQRKVVSIVADFSKPQGLYERIEAELKAATATGGVGVLVNNVGVSYPGALFFHELEQYAPGRTAELINLNVLATTKMTQIVLPGMLERKRGAIINISSAAGRIPIGNPLYAVCE
jgi:17beta-estradiol 17-dehydrogenase / very-long-chain 3-oxoacyl-CoA reductase